MGTLITTITWHHRREHLRHLGHHPEELDEFGYNSQQKALAAVRSGRFEDEIVPVPVKKKKEIVEFKVDEHPRDTDLEKMAKLKAPSPPPLTAPSTRWR